MDAATSRNDGKGDGRVVSRHRTSFVVTPTSPPLLWNKMNATPAAATASGIHADEKSRSSAPYLCVREAPTRDVSYYAKCAAGGACASVVRWILTPLEVVKGYQQVGLLTQMQQHLQPMHCYGRNPARIGMTQGLRLIWIQEGFSGLFKGLGPTAVAYSLQTGTKLGLYEYLRDHWSSSSTSTWSQKPSGWVCLVSAATAEVCASVLMCPWEMVRVQMQTTSPASSAGIPTKSFSKALWYMIKHRVDYRFPFGGLGTLWARQIPGTMVNLYTFENTVHFIYQHIMTRPKDSYHPSVQLSVTLVSGYLAGFVCALVTHPADSLLSLRNRPQHQRQRWYEIGNQVGWTQLATRGLAPRALTLGTIIGCQWWIYDSFKMIFMGL